MTEQKQNDCYCPHGGGQVHLRSPSACPTAEQEENELICEKLLGWRRLPTGRWNNGLGNEYSNIYGDQWPLTPSFTTWADAGLILEALVARNEVTLNGDSRFKSIWTCELGNGGSDAHMSGPLAIRAAALSYIESLK